MRDSASVAMIYFKGSVEEAPDSATTANLDVREKMTAVFCGILYKLTDVQDVGIRRC